MISPIANIIRRATKNESSTYNIISFPTHERYQSCMAKVNARFYLWQQEGIKNWNFNYGGLPENHVLLNPARGTNQLPLDLTFDCVLSQNKFGQFQVAEQLAKRFHIPLISLEHTLPMPHWTPLHMAELRKQQGHINLFISEYSRKEWGWAEDEAEVIHHGVDSELFCNQKKDRQNVVLSVCNDWINRDWCCGFKSWQRVTQGLPVRVVGDTPGLSKPAASTEELVHEYNSYRVFLNTAHISPIPTALLEAMACGCACVSVATCMIPEIIQHGENGFISNNEVELKKYINKLMKDEALASKLGESARKTIQDKFGLETFTERWNEIIRSTDNIIYTG